MGVLEVISDESGYYVSPDTRLDEIDMDETQDRIALAAELELEFGIQIPSEEEDTWVIAQDVIETVERLAR